MNQNQLLICSVGGTPQPILQSIRAVAPSRVLLWHTTATRAVAEQVVQDSQTNPGCVDFRSVSDEQDFRRCVIDARKLRSDVDSWSGRSKTHGVIVDFTGGTKVMSAALALVAHRWKCLFAYVGGTQRTKDGIGTVIDGSEKHLKTENPLNSLAYQPVIDAVHLFNAGYPAGARKLLDDAIRQPNLDAPIKRGLTALQHMLQGYAQWDAFAHGDAVKKFDDMLKAQNDLDAILPGHHLIDEVRKHRDLCEKLSQCGQNPTLLLVNDLRANAERRAAAGQYDDAVARLYRATEALAQTTLKDRYSIVAAEVPLEKLPDAIRPQFDSKTNCGFVKLALQDCYAVLKAFGDAIGQTFFEIGLASETSPLTARNQSILAHGFQAASSKTYEGLKKKLAELAGEIEPVPFPPIQEP